MTKRTGKEQLPRDPINASVRALRIATGERSEDDESKDQKSKADRKKEARKAESTS